MRRLANRARLSNRESPTAPIRGAARAALTLALALSCVPCGLAQPVSGKVVAAGFRADNQTGYVARLGQWIPIVCELRANQSDHFQGRLVCEQRDLDGDRVAYVEAPLVVTGGGADKRAWVYAASLGKTGDVPRGVNVVSDDGALITSLNTASAEIEFLDDCTMLVLDVSDRPLARLQGRIQSSNAFSHDRFNDRNYLRDCVVSNMPCEQLPDRWYGLEAVDVVIWDKPAPARLSNAQLEALATWVRFGGQLIVGVGESWAAIRGTALEPLLPYKGDEPNVEARRLGRFLDTFKTGATPDDEFPHPISVCMAALAGGNEMRTWWDRLPDGRTVNLIVMNPVGAGRVTAVATAISDLLSVNVRNDFYHQLLDLQPVAASWLQAGRESFLGPLANSNLAQHITRPTEFGGVGAVLRFSVFAFVVAYIFVATLGSWWWLSRQALSHFSWTVFALCAIVASVLGVAMVNLTRGLSTGLNAVQIVDLEAGQRRGAGPCWFGYASPVRQTIDLSLDGAGCFLRPMTQPRMVSESEYSTPTQYEVLPARATLHRATMRASLKQLEGFWSGELDGTVSGQIVIDGQTGRVSDESWLRNELGAEIVQAYLLYLDPRLDPSSVFRAAPSATDYRGVLNYRGDPAISAMNVLVAGVGPLKPGERTAAAIGAREYAQFERDYAAWQADPKPESEPFLPTLRRRQLEWVRQFATVVPSATADPRFGGVLLASTRSLYLHMDEAIRRMGIELSSDGMNDIDISHWLTRNEAALIAFTESPGPARLLRNGAPRPTDRGYTVYRVRIPVVQKGKWSGARRPAETGMPETSGAPQPEAGDE
ncbi:MAG: hypothetical protein CHACPFDD_00288 [Phycisphaerae bacterium]|nr:hypothetical protein [Phycisphaerae bacterium]